MDSLNDLIWNPEDDDLLNPNGIGEGCMREICITAFCIIDFPGPANAGGLGCGDPTAFYKEYCRGSTP